ncbi:MAG: hypothetical protein Q8L35_07965 [Actinomycetota bacterium]|nr:hypothetical protein [Actinomycetota bacterium]
MEEQRITLNDLRRKIDQLNRAVAADLTSRRSKLYAGAAAALAAAVLVSYFVGKKHGRRR